jgi:hypothetical protein
MIDTTPVTRELTKLISNGTSGEALLTAAVQLFPNLSAQELSQVLQVATDKAEKQAARRH